jgi:hypothetical protein
MTRKLPKQWQKCWPIAAAAALWLAMVSGPAQAITLQSWATSAEIRSGNTTLVEAPDPATPTLPDQSTGSLEANGTGLVPSGPIDAGAVAEFGLSSGVIAAGGYWDGAANAPADNRLFGVFGGAATSYFDDLTVTSGSLAMGTAVDVRFVFDLAFSADASVTAGNVDASNYATTAADVQVVANGVVGIDQNANRYLDALDSGSFIQTGIFTGAQHAEFTISTFVGSTFSFAAVVDADTFGALHPNSGGVNGAANAESILALAFGAEVVGADAAVQSALLGGAFPAASLVSPAAAQNALPANPFAVPEPSTATLLLAAALVLPRIRARSRRG